MSNYLNFQEIYETVMRAIGDAQYSRETEVKAICNLVYLNEICQCDTLYPLFWLYEVDDEKKTKAPVTAITAITKATPPVVTSIAHGLITGDVVTMYDVVGMTELNYRTFHATRLTADTFSLQDLSLTDIAGAGYAAAGTSGKAHHRGTSITECKRILNANWHGYKAMEAISPDEISRGTTWLDVSTTTPTRRFHRKIFTAAGLQYDYLLWYPAASAVLNLHIQYETQPVRLSATTDVPLGPAQIGDAIVAGTAMRLGENKVQMEAGSLWPSIYKMSLEAITQMNRQWWKDNKQSERSRLFLV
jgi:hypothetical protein